jgi:hypothetical protein
MEEIGGQPITDTDKLPDAHDGASCDYDPQLMISHEGTDKADAGASPSKPFSKEMPFRSPPPVSADPSVPDPMDYIRSSSPSRTPTHIRPALGSLPGTPTLILSPHPTPGRPTPVSVPVSTAILKAMQIQQSLSSSSGLFTPQTEAEDASPQEFDDGESVSNSMGEALEKKEEASADKEMQVEKGEEFANEQATTDNAMVAVDDDAISSQIQTVSEDHKVVEEVPRQTLNSTGGTVNGDSGVEHSPISRRPNDFPSDAGSSASEELELMYPFESLPQEDVARGFSDDNHTEDFSTTFDVLESKVASPPDREPTPTARDNFKNSDLEASSAETSLMVDQPALIEESVEPQESGRSKDVEPSVISSNNLDARLEEDPFKLMGNKSTVAPGAVDDKAESDESYDSESSDSESSDTAEIDQ